MKILYVSDLAEYDSAWYRALALRREGHEVTTVNTLEYGQKQSVLRKLEFRLAAGPEVRRLNSDILRLARQECPDVLWADKVLWMKTATLQELRGMGAVTVSYMIDNFFGPRRDPGWRLYAKAIPFYDLHCTQRDSNLQDYRTAGAQDVIKVQTAFEPTIHFPAAPPYTDTQRDRGVSFIGTPYDERGATLTRLHGEGFPVVISGVERQWAQALNTQALRDLFTDGKLTGSRYREGIWRSRINLSFLTHSNQDEFAHKSFEIAACGGFLLAERSKGHLDRFREDEEAVFFSGYEELVAKVRRYLPDEAARNRIAFAGQQRAWSSGYDNDTQVRRIVDHIRPMLSQRDRRP